MIGLADNEAIVKLAAIQQYRAEGLPLEEAVIKGGRRRLRAIAMTSLTTVTGVLPLVIGAGAVGSEFADIFNAFGTKVTLIEVLPRILPFEDAESSDAITKSFKKRGIAVHAGAKVTKATVGKDKVTLEVETGGKKETVEA